MISLRQAKKILNKGERKYTDEEVKHITETLEMMAELQIETEKYRASKGKVQDEIQQEFDNLDWSEEERHQ